VSNSNTVCETSHVGIVNYDLAKILPISVRLNIGDTTGLTPPSRSSSAKFIQILNSYRVSPPSIDAINTPSGCKVVLNALKVVSSSLTQCSYILLIIKSKVCGSNLVDHSSSSSRTSGTLS
jgi:hypothetical protein